MWAFLFIIFAVLGTVWGWVWLRLVETCALPAPLYYSLAMIFTASLALQVLRWAARNVFENRLWLQYLTYFFFGQMIILLLGAIVKDALFFTLSLAGLPLGVEAERWASATVLLASVAGKLWGVHTALRGPVVRKVTVPLPHWPATHLGLKVAQISDLHVGTSIKRDYVEGVVRQVMDLEPDLIALTGDIGDGNVFELTQDLEPLRELKAPLGVFYVAGNHEYYWNVKSWTAKMRELGFTVLENRGHWLKKASLWIGGVPDISAHRMEPGQTSDPSKALPSERLEGPRILLAHQPKSVFGAAAAGFDLMLSGHTHSGQFFPANLVVRFFNPYHHGLYRHEGKMWVYVNAGTGFWGPPLRLFVPAEITLLKLVPEAGEEGA